jgi:CDP-glucose 4,6-dehydratase
MATRRGRYGDIAQMGVTNNRMNRAFEQRRVFVTGHTGFKGAWLCEWLLSMGAEVHGYSLPSPTSPALFAQLGLAERIDSHEIGDIRDEQRLQTAVVAARPDYVFHLAAQSLVRASYSDPVDTYSANVMGTVHLLNALRKLEHPCSAVFVTTDKCYENREWMYGYREEDALGGKDPYSSSKAAAEIAIASFRDSFFKDHPVRIASARAGNVIGGGDWATDRIVPDAMRALQRGIPISVRNPNAIRPWQHVLEPLSGYLWLAAQLSQQADATLPLCSAFNFGPGREGNRTVSDLVNELLVGWPGRWVDTHDAAAVHEAGLLHLAVDKASSLLEWEPVWSFSEAIARTVEWYRTESNDRDQHALRGITENQINAAVTSAREKGLKWASND